VRDLLANEGIDEALRRAFLVYLISHDRPMAEVLAVRRKDIAAEFERGFVGMTRQPVELDDLLAAREALVNEIVGSMPDAHRQFLLAFERGEPDWSAIGLGAAADLPAVRWRQQNLDGLSVVKRGTLVTQLEEVLAR
jgi:hypothetical protein